MKCLHSVLTLEKYDLLQKKLKKVPESKDINVGYISIAWHVGSYRCSNVNIGKNSDIIRPPSSDLKT